MDPKLILLTTFLTVVVSTSLSTAKPISLVERCWCRQLAMLHPRTIREIKILQTPNCSFQVIAKLKNSNKEVCVSPDNRWLQPYIKNALNKARMFRKEQQSN